MYFSNPLTSPRFILLLQPTYLPTFKAIKYYLYCPYALVCVDFAEGSLPGASPLKLTLHLLGSYQLPIAPLLEVGASCSTHLSMLKFCLVWAWGGLVHALSTAVNSCSPLPCCVQTTVIYYLWLLKIPHPSSTRILELVFFSLFFLYTLINWRSLC